MDARLAYFQTGFSIVCLVKSISNGWSIFVLGLVKY